MENLKSLVALQNSTRRLGTQKTKLQEESDQFDPITDPSLQGRIDTEESNKNIMGLCIEEFTPPYCDDD